MGLIKMPLSEIVYSVTITFTITECASINDLFKWLRIRVKPEDIGADDSNFVESNPYSGSRTYENVEDIKCLQLKEIDNARFRSTIPRTINHLEYFIVKVTHHTDFFNNNYLQFI